jgi:hypothetical protein
MKALSVRQPYAELILQGKKTIELRKWNTNFRGEFLIHSSKISDMNAMTKMGFKELPCGFILGKVKLVDVKHYKNEEEHLKDKDKHLASSFWGNHGFVLENPARFDKPISCKGNLGFWEFNEENKGIKGTLY